MILFLITICLLTISIVTENPAWGIAAIVLLLFFVLADIWTRR